MRKVRVIGVIALIIVACIVAAACNTGSAKKGQTGDWTKAALEQYKGQYSYYKTLDINGDGTQELLLSTESGDFFTGDAKVMLLAQVDGEIKEVQDLSYAGGTQVYFNEDEHRLTWMTRLSGERQEYVYEYANGELKEEFKIEYYAQNHNPNVDTNQDTYYINGDETNEAEFNKIVNKYAAEGTALTLEEMK